MDGSVNLSNPPEERSLTITPSGPLSWKVTEIVGIDPQKVKAVVSAAAIRTRANDSGEDLVYRAMMECHNPPISTGMMLNMFRVMGDQVRITGAWRLFDVVLIDFSEDPPSQPGQIFLPPDVKITATLFVPGPAPGPMARKVANATFEIVSAICALALGRPVEITSLAHFPVSPEIAEQQRARRYDASILGLTRNSVSLDIFGELMALGGRMQ